MKRIIFLLVFLFTGSVNAAVVTSYYGDDDGFGVGETSGLITSSTTSNASLGEAAFTDVRLIAAGFGGPAFQPIASFDGFVLDGAITSILLTMRVGSFDSSIALEAPNRIYLDGMLVDSAFIDGFSTLNTQRIETRSISLDASFFALFADGDVSLAGTLITEASGSGSFQVDFLSLEITTDSTSVPEASTFGLLLLGLVGLGFGRLRKRA